MNIVQAIKNIKAEYWTAAATVVLAVFSALLYEVTDRTVKDSEAVQRAFISFNNHSDMRRVINPAGVIEGFTIAPMLENNGITPARKVRNYASGKAFNGPLPIDSNFPDIWPNGVPHQVPGPVVLAPKGSMLSNFVFVSPIEMQQAASDPINHPFYMWGWATYEDVFGQPHRMEYCSQVARVSPATFDPRVLGQGADILWSLCPIHNCTDDDCNKQKQNQ